ncbi:endoplasmic reticulum-golgi intermediate compartment protein, putative [Entamoeba invadens IP1]|uniref:Endoplasmic reticulum-golgi intermediate compartment protein, putative n=1 Tax=Entamoeba invadens IP1 TaxID=370355 RepID=A0A0A1UG22_ENTIV|nr:endoplasmic reticulum-golgi intermediate compartment protein, putative [Entamoeba invadens IP1]ELP92159.1 endoplasmic reticulum-golgi intermediate compartment protein, putative [Entamoeba invadens IP1]|eukprot:XP_004258930.1 endoplasmic reticulum-golgi intermediate compartment protein, putative [Entamoeba invadens IP1]
MDTIKRFDAYPKLNYDVRVRYWLGGLLSILCLLTMGWMFYSEVQDYYTVQMRPTLRVDESKSEKLPINFDITFPRISCSLMTIDVLDTTGEVSIDIESNVNKKRLNPHSMTESSNKATAHKVYGIECPACEESVDKNKCCFTCDELKESYKKAGKEVPPNAVQCQLKNIQKMALALDGEGCHMYGSVFVNRVSGNFHIAPGMSEQQGEGHRHSAEWIGSLNLTHTWNSLSFGDNFPGMIKPMDSIQKVDVTNNSMYQYFVQVVPMTYFGLDKKVVKTNGYSVTEHYRSGNLKTMEQGVPGVFVLYEISSMEVLYTEETGSFGHLLTGICGIVGGIFTIFSLLDAFIFHTVGGLFTNKAHKL